ncbi:MAG: fasciclin domain-containing protein [Bacteroidota bacterium]
MKRIPFLLTILTLILIVSCSDDDNGNFPPPSEVTLNIVETAQARDDMTSLVAALLKADESSNNDLIGTLSNASATFTVLAPSNDAFTELLERLDGFDSLDDFDTQAEQDLLAAILSYHVVSGTAAASGDLSNNQALTTVQGENVTVSTEGGISFVDVAGESASVGMANQLATNGIIHIIDKVLIPQAAIDALGETLLFSITATAIRDTNLSSLVAALQAADGDLPTVLQGAGPFTVLAPSNEAFATFLGDQELGDIPTDVLEQVLLNHVIPGEVASTNLTMAGSGYASTSANGPVDGSNISIFYNTADGVVFNNVSTVMIPDVKATNGIIHVVDAVIGLPNIVDHALANPNLSDLVGLLTQGGDTTFTDLLSNGETNFTVFAPVNGSFDDFTTTNEIPNVLSNHVVAGAAALSTGLATGYDISTAATNADGDNISLYINLDDGVRFNGVSSVVEGGADIVATNGVIHAVDAVIDIPTITTFAVADPNFSTLVSALTTLTPGTPFEEILARTMDGNGDNIDPPFTVFAPINAAFEALDAIPDETVLTQVLLHHVVGGANVRSTDLTPDGTTEAPTLEGDMITITLPGTDDNIADIMDGSGATDIGIIAVDVQAGNGVIHAINKVMIPNIE